ncbi:Six-hairpin glycosidase, partial [Pyrenochaeta sp. DS3sAY3a]
ASASITDPTQRAEFALSTLQIWYNAGTGLWETSGWWNSANILTMIGNLVKADPENKRFRDLATRVFANTVTQAPVKNPQPGIESDVPSQKDTQRGKTSFTLFNETGSESGYTKVLNPDTFEPHSVFPDTWYKANSPYIDISSLPIFSSLNDETDQITLAATPNPADWLDGFYDDDLWWALAWINAYDVTLNTQYLTLAEGIFAAVTKAWPTRCGNGGIFWNWEKEYMNAIANELFLSTAAHLATRVDDDEKKDAYTDWARRTLAWFLDSGMLNANGTINDGLTESCANNGGTTWSYNQGVILGGLVEMHRASPDDTSYLALATRIAKAALLDLSDANGVIHDVCEPACGFDGEQFKGIFMRNLGVLHAAAADDVFGNAISVNAESVWENDREGE